MTRFAWRTCLAAGVTLALAIFPAAKAPGQGPAADAPQRVTPASVVQRSPVEAFRRLLAMPAAERDAYLTNYPAATRERIQAKVDEYRILPPPFGEMRLAMTELCWYLMPLLRSSSTNRAAQVAVIPEPYRDLVTARLTVWDITPPMIKEQVLEYQAQLQQFVGPGVMDPQMVNARVAGPKLQNWLALPEADRRQTLAYFTNFLALNDDEKDQVLAALPSPERQQTEKVVEPMKNWSKPEVATYVSAFQKFSSMSPAERDQFMQSAQRWERMTEAEREAWRRLVRQTSPATADPHDSQLDHSSKPSGTSPVLKTNPVAARSN
jgi:hypothetical protein